MNVSLTPGEVRPLRAKQSLWGMERPDFDPGVGGEGGRGDISRHNGMAGLLKRCRGAPGAAKEGFTQEQRKSLEDGSNARDEQN